MLGRNELCINESYQPYMDKQYHYMLGRFELCTDEPYQTYISTM